MAVPRSSRLANARLWTTASSGRPERAQRFGKRSQIFFLGDVAGHDARHVQVLRERFDRVLLMLAEVGEQQAWRLRAKMPARSRRPGSTCWRFPERGRACLREVLPHRHYRSFMGTPPRLFAALRGVHEGEHLERLFIGERAAVWFRKISRSRPAAAGSYPLASDRSGSPFRRAGTPRRRIFRKAAAHAPCRGGRLSSCRRPRRRRAWRRA